MRRASGSGPFNLGPARKRVALPVGSGTTRLTDGRSPPTLIMILNLSSVLAIVALLAGRFYGWSWLDPAMGAVGALVIAQRSWRLIRTAGANQLDTVPSQKLAPLVRERIEVGDDRVTDLHLWRLGPGHAGLIVSVVSGAPRPPDVYKQRLADIEGLSHVTVEVHTCPDHLQRKAI
jgi:Co/Zn/Cd efflux system component